MLKKKKKKILSAISSLHVPEKHRFLFLSFFFTLNELPYIYKCIYKTSNGRSWLTFLQLMLIKNLTFILFGISFLGGEGRVDVEKFVSQF